jgi:protein-tyrosine phosphatase
MKILFVCLGNICRSPLAEAVMKHKLEMAGLSQHVTVDSCGTANFHVGEPPDDRTISVAQRNGIAITHIGRELQRKDLDDFDLVLAMDRSIMRHINVLGKGRGKADVRLFRTFDNVPDNYEVPDPWYGDDSDFDKVFTIINRTCDGILAYIQQKKLKQ